MVIRGLSVSRPPVLYVSGALDQIKIGGKVAGDWQSSWVNRLLCATLFDPEGSKTRGDGLVKGSLPVYIYMWNLMNERKSFKISLLFVSICRSLCVLSHSISF